MPVEQMTGKTILAAVGIPFASGFDGALEQVQLTFTDGSKVVLSAGSYACPEESCIYVSEK